jgi:flagellar biosynthetic protein FliO
MDFVQQLAMVLLVLALLAGLVWALRNRGMASFRFAGRSSGSAKRLQVIERLPLTPSHSLHLVRLADRVLLIGVAPSGCTLLDASKQNEAFLSQTNTQLGVSS